jgi:hypothetical protein
MQENLSGLRIVAGGIDDLSTVQNCPPVECKPWCVEGDGHPNEQLRADQFCISQAREVVLHAWPKVELNELGEQVPSQIAVVLTANIDEPMHIEVVLDDIAGHIANFNMTCEEAHDLAIDLLLLVAQAKGKI